MDNGKLLGVSRSALSGGMAYGEAEQGHDHTARENSQDEPGFGLPVGLELSGKRPIGELLELSAPDELGESGSPDTVEVAGARPAQRFIGLWVPRGERLREIAPSADRSCHQKERANQPNQSDETDCLLGFHDAFYVGSAVNPRGRRS